MPKKYNEIEHVETEILNEDDTAAQTESTVVEEEKREIKTVPVKKKSLATRFIHAITPEGGFKQLASDTFFNSIVPAGKDMLFNAANGALNAIIYNGRNNGGVWNNAMNGAANGARQSMRRTGGVVPYNTMGRNTQTPRNVTVPRHDFTLVEHYDQGDADYVLGQMRQYLNDQGYVTVADYYAISNAEQSGVTPNYTDNNFGWYDLTHARSIRAQSGYFTLTLPPVQTIN